jgi:hypothetical protein
MNIDNSIKPALLTRTEIEWLLGKKQVSKSYEYYMRSSIKKKLRTWKELELPMLMEKGLIQDNLDLSIYSKNLSANSKVVREIELFPASDPQGIIGGLTLYLLPHSLRGARCRTSG